MKPKPKHTPTMCGVPKKTCSGRTYWDINTMSLQLRYPCSKCYLTFRKKGLNYV